VCAGFLFSTEIFGIVICPGSSRAISSRTPDIAERPAPVDMGDATTNDGIVANANHTDTPFRSAESGNGRNSKILT
jgi:hypothetical protein